MIITLPVIIMFDCSSVNIKTFLQRQGGDAEDLCICSIECCYGSWHAFAQSKDCDPQYAVVVSGWGNLLPVFSAKVFNQDTKYTNQKS